MASVYRPKNSDPPSGRARDRPWQFNLRHVFALMAGVCVLGAAYHWLGLGVFFLIGVIGVVVVVAAAMTQKEVVALLVAISLVGVFVAWVFPAMQASTSRPRSPCSNNLKQIGIAVHNYHDTYGCFPPAYIADASGRPMHSWRVLILPFLEQQALYARYDFSEPWDGPNNRQLAAEMPRVYRCPQDKAQGASDTSYVAVVGAGSIWPGDKTVTMGDVADGTSNTLLVVESHGSGINWMEPRDLSRQQLAAGINAQNGLGICSSHGHRVRGRGEGAQALFADGATKFLPNDVSPHVLNGLSTIAGGESVTPP